MADPLFFTAFFFLYATCMVVSSIVLVTTPGSGGATGGCSCINGSGGGGGGGGGMVVVVDYMYRSILGLFKTNINEEASTSIIETSTKIDVGSRKNIDSQLKIYEQIVVQFTFTKVVKKADKISRPTFQWSHDQRQTYITIMYEFVRILINACN